MSIKFACLAATAALLIAPATAADRHRESGDKIIITLDKVDVGDPAALEAVREALRAAAKDACSITGSRLTRARCVDQFVDDAVVAVKNDELRIALTNGAGEGGGGRGAVASPPGE